MVIGQQAHSDWFNKSLKAPALGLRFSGDYAGRI